jgi:hypothetical protein
MAQEQIEKQISYLYTLNKDINKLEKVLKNQLYYQSKHIVPKRFAPKQYLLCNDNNTTLKFQQDFQFLFFQHLSTVINTNNISIHIMKAKLSTELKNIQYTLSVAIAPKNFIQEKYEQLKQVFPQIQTDIQPSQATKNTEDPPQHVIATTTDDPPQQTPTISRIERKRRNTFTKLPATKHTKITDYFLAKRPTCTQNPI